MKKIQKKSLTISSLALVIASVMALVGCQSTASIASKPVDERGKHQADHGASAGHRAAFIEDYDTNSDGQVARLEFDAVRAANLKAMDANGNGLVDETEY
ncbi:MAG TPA: hypothetical protein VLC79_01895, partial [Cellvibrio sp.]|nr:hypothetical protein [Cellvibrio sp.]